MTFLTINEIFRNAIPSRIVGFSALAFFSAPSLGALNDISCISQDTHTVRIQGVYFDGNTSQRVATTLPTVEICKALESEIEDVIADQWMNHGCEAGNEVYFRELSVGLSPKGIQILGRPSLRFHPFGTELSGSGFQQSVAPYTNASGESACDPL